MDKLRALVIIALSLAVPFVAAGSGTASRLVRAAAYASAGEGLSRQESAESTPASDSAESSRPSGEPSAPADEPSASTAPSEPSAPTAPSDEPPEPDVPQVPALSQNIEGIPDGVDFSLYTAESGAVIRKNYGTYSSDDYITLPSGAQVRNCTSDDMSMLKAAAATLPPLDIDLSSGEPVVLIVHTHTTECFMPAQSAAFDADMPTRTTDSSFNMVAVGEAMAASLAANGIPVLHDGTMHDYPLFPGAYDRSEDTIRACLEQYPSIKIVIDLHRDAIDNADGSRVAPVAEINGRSAAQFMIIAGCDNDYFDMPDYIENFKLACLLQDCAGELYPGLARPVLFDYRNYNQHITTGSLLIEVGSCANSFDEALYTGELLGDVFAAALARLSA